MTSMPLRKVYEIPIGEEQGLVLPGFADALLAKPTVELIYRFMVSTMSNGVL